MSVVKPIVQTAAGNTLRSGRDLAAAGLIKADAVAAADAAARALPIAITPEIAALIDMRDADDPIARQFVPDPRELEAGDEERADPIGDRAFSPLSGIVHRYPDRVLLMPVMTCPVYCRFCFRRDGVGPAGGALTEAELDAALDYIRGHDEIREVILSGGDPLMLSPGRLGAITAALDSIAQIEVIRVHTRVPVADPGRITADLVRALRTATPVYVVLHCNHPRELAPAARNAVRALVDSGIPMLSQTVLLKGVNDDADTMEALMRALVRNRIKPYYLHHADLARGTGHFRTTIAAGRSLMRSLRGRISGLCQPTYVLDVPGGFGKAPLGPDYVSQDAAGGWRIRDWQGRTHAYPAPAAGGTDVTR